MLIRKKTAGIRFFSFAKQPLCAAFFSFLILVLFGAIVLSLPFAVKEDAAFGFFDALFTSVSALCSVGFGGIETTSLFTIQGKCFLLILIQLGGMGFWSFVFLFTYLLKKNTPARNRSFVKASRGEIVHTDIKIILSFILKLFFFFELTGAILLSVWFIPRFGFSKGLFYSIFHSISAFCNSGFLLMDLTETGLGEEMVQFILSILCICGGLGMFVWEDLFSYRKRKKLQLHTKISILGSLALLIFGFLCLFPIEYLTGGERADFSRAFKQAWFISADMRTAGFWKNWIPQLQDTSKLICIFLMFIGGGVASSAGGIKLSSLVLLVVSMISDIRQKKEIVIAGNRIDRNLVKKAFLFFILPFIGIFMISFLFVLLESQKLASNQISYLDILFQTVSAFSSVGLVSGTTSFLSMPSQILMIPLMISGRIGATMLFFKMTEREKKKDRVVFPQTHIQLN